MAARKEHADQRRRELAMIHIAQQELGMDDETYRHMLWTIGRVHSAADLDSAGRKTVIHHLKGCGFKVKRQQRRVTPSDDRAPLINKVRALLGPDRDDNYALGILKKMFRDAAPARLEWASPDQLRKVVAALNYDKRRHHTEDKS